MMFTSNSNNIGFFVKSDKQEDVNVESYILTIDIGTSSCKAALFTDAGIYKALAKGSYRLLFPEEGYVEQNPEEIFDGICAAVKKLEEKGNDLKKVCAIAFSAQIASQCLVDKEGKILTNLLSWMDTRAKEETLLFHQTFSQEEAEKLTGVDMVVTPSYSITKLRWLREHQPEMLKKAAGFVQIKDYVIWKLTGRWVSDVTSLKGLVHPKTRQVIPEILKFTGISEELLPEICEPNEIAGYLKENVKGFESLLAGIPVITGWNDMNAAFLGMGGLVDGYIGMDLTGTSEHLGCIGPCQKVNKDAYKGLNRVPFMKSREIFYGVTSSGGQAVEWYVKDFIGATDVKKYLENVCRRERELPIARDNELIFLPYLEGERNPWNNPSARGVLFGLNRSHRQADIAVAILEGVSFALRTIYDRLPHKPEMIIVSGGASFNNIWNQMKADVMNVKFGRLEITEVGCAGAAMLTMSALNPDISLEQLSTKMLKVEKVYKPNLERYRIYEKKYQKFLKLYRCLEQNFWNQEEEK